jgi:glutamine amidotransferase
MQWLFEGSDEAPGLSGLAAFSGCSHRFPLAVKTPHVGWNRLHRCSEFSHLLCGVEDGSFAYFTHSYCLRSSTQTVATSEYAGEFSAVVEHNNLFGVQFHPEKSAGVGLKILANFCSLPC